MGVGPRRRRRDALRRRQRRRGRTGDVQGPHADARAIPYRIVEGLAIAAFCVDAPTAFVGVKRSFGVEVANLRRAAVELGDAGLLGDLSISIVEGPDEYLFGEEKALLEVIEGRDPLPRLLPPWQHGLFATVTMGWEAGTPAGRRPGEQPDPRQQRRDAGGGGARPRPRRHVVSLVGDRRTRRAR